MVEKSGKKKVLTILGIVVGVIIILLIASYFLIARPKDLGVRYSQKDVESVNAKLGITYSSLPDSSDPKATYTIEGKRDVDITLTNEELTALMAEHSEQWKNYPVSDVQMKVNEDGSFELSGKLEGKSWDDYATATNMPDRFKNFVGEKANLVPMNPAFYMKGTMAVQDGEVTGDVQEMKIGQITVDTTWFQNNNNFVTDFAKDRILAAGITAESISFGPDGVHLKGTVPESIGFG